MGQEKISTIDVKVRNHKTCLLSPNGNTDISTLCHVTEYIRIIFHRIQVNERNLNPTMRTTKRILWSHGDLNAEHSGHAVYG